MAEEDRVNKQQAEVIATQAIQQTKPEAGFTLVSAQTLERDFGWVFFFTTRRYIETHDPGALVPGAGPVIVLRHNGRTTFLPTSVPPTVAVEQFEREWHSSAEK